MKWVKGASIISLLSLMGVALAQQTMWDVATTNSDPTFSSANATLGSVENIAGQDFLNLTLGSWGNVAQNFPTARNWGSYNGFRMTVENLEDFPLSIAFKARLANSTDTMLGIYDVGPHEKLQVIVDNGAYIASNPLAHLPQSAIPSYYRHNPVFTPRNLAAVAGWMLYYRGDLPARMKVSSIEALNVNYSTVQSVDKFGQKDSQVWTGKAYTDGDLLSQASAESADNLANPGPGETWGSSTLRATATGKWRTIKGPTGNWYFVTPQGKLFWSFGATSVRDFNPTVTQGRESTFKVLPATGAPYSEFFTDVWSNGASRRAFDFYGRNLKAKYGTSWTTDWKGTANARLRSWGMNTLGSGSTLSLMASHNLPGVTSHTTSGFHTRLATPDAFWGTLPDPFAGDFQYFVESTWRSSLMSYDQTGKLIGVFVDGENSWGVKAGTPRQRYQIPLAALRAPKGQPAKIKFINELRGRYVTVANLNAAWGTTFSSWTYMYNESIEITDSQMTTSCLEDCSKFLGTFATNYYYKIKMGLRAMGYQGLFLGSKDHPGWTPHEVFVAMAKQVDVISVTLYGGAAQIPLSYLESFNKPILIAEFAFSKHGAGTGASRGSNPAVERSSEDRAQATEDYLQRALSSKFVIGVHWFTYIDEPLTGRPMDGANYPLGIVSISDRPH
ncbi:MAG: hypothetical protein ABL962_06845, partial [Fimbriimonadaceae bacterium]